MNPPPHWPSQAQRTMRCLAVLALGLGAAAAAPSPPSPAPRLDDPSGWWSLKPLALPGVPKPRDASRLTNPIDAFIVAKLEEKGLALSSEADRRALIRRL